VEERERQEKRSLASELGVVFDGRTGAYSTVGGKTLISTGRCIEGWEEVESELTVENEDGLKSHRSPSFHRPLKQTSPLGRFSSVGPYDVVEVEKVDETYVKRAKGSARGT